MKTLDTNDVGGCHTERLEILHIFLIRTAGIFSVGENEVVIADALTIKALDLLMFLRKQPCEIGIRA